MEGSTRCYFGAGENVATPPGTEKTLYGSPTKRARRLRGGIGRSSSWGLASLVASRAKDGTLYFSSRQMPQIQATLPAGWALPTVTEAEKLLQVINFVPERLSRFAPSRKGAYDPAGKTWVGVGTASIYLLDAPDRVLVINPLGGRIAPLEGKEVHARIRLVRR